jgi:hypothetical protein
MTQQQEPVALKWTFFISDDGSIPYSKQLPGPSTSKLD